MLVNQALLAFIFQHLLLLFLYILTITFFFLRTVFLLSIFPNTKPRQSFSTRRLHRLQNFIFLFFYILYCLYIPLHILSSLSEYALVFPEVKRAYVHQPDIANDETTICAYDDSSLVLLMVLPSPSLTFYIYFSPSTPVNDNNNKKLFFPMYIYLKNMLFSFC